MRRLLAAALIAATATTLTGTALSGTASAEDCVTRYLMLDDEAELGWVTLNDDGSVTVHPNRVVADANTQVARTGVLVDCIV